MAERSLRRKSTMSTRGLIISNMGIVQFKPERGRPRIMPIPKTFKVLGNTIKTVMVSKESLVKVIKDLTPGADKRRIGKVEVGSHDGVYDHTTKTIYLSNDLKGASLVQTWLHERNHCILYSMGRDELSEDEGFVDLLAEMLYQATMSQRGRLN